MTDHERLKAIPSVDSVLTELDRSGHLDGLPKPMLVVAVRAAIQRLREELLASSGATSGVAEQLRARAIELATEEMVRLRRSRLRPLINATGVIVHTNLGRAPLSKRALERIASVAGGYSNLEYDISRGRRGHRGDVVRDYLCRITGAEDALVTNNNAAAVLLALNTLALGREVVISRSELIEIGGSFRLPEVFERSGARMRAVGTTNRTRADDYRRALGNRTAAVMTAHWSNYSIAGFVERVGLKELVEICASWKLPLLHDLGSGILSDPAEIGLAGEMSLTESVAAGVSVVTASGDKLLGGPQAGIALGRRDVIARMRSNPMMRAVRPGKLTLAALESTLETYMEGVELEEIPVLSALQADRGHLEERARGLCAALERSTPEACRVEVVATEARVGGGAAPEHSIESFGLAISPSRVTADDLTRRLRQRDRPVVARTAEGRVILDLRTVSPESDEELLAAVTAALEQG